MAHMIRFGWILLLLVICSCGNRKEEEKDDDGFSYEGFSQGFRTLSTPYQLSDTGLLNLKDTTQIRSNGFAALMPDSLKSKWMGKGAKPKFYPVGRFAVTAKTNLYLVRVANANRRMALLYAFDGDAFTAVFPFLIPDSDPSTSQLTAMDKAWTITKSVTQKKQSTVTGEGKDVYDYDAELKQFTLTLTNPLNSNVAVINPIDTFPRKHKLSGDYVKDKKNYVSIRDGRYPNQLQVFIRLDQNSGACTGELKGDLLLTSGTTAIYRQGGDPCVMRFQFSGSKLTITEESGCGSRRGLDCSFDGSYARKKETKTKSATARK